MLPEGSIAGVGIWKRFKADRRRRMLRDELQRLNARRRGDASTGWRWALKDITLRAEPGDAIGLIGANGSGKSTLLKILTRVMYPYAGSVDVTGRVGALIEVRAGIHPELTGRENIFLYGSLLGLRRKQVADRFDAIIDFADLPVAIDRPVKFYSSGMQMRLGFAVAAFLEPHVLLVDEVLAVGDASFQQRCLDRMRAVLAEGTTLVFVSHDLAAVNAVCTRGMWLNNGQIQAEGSVGDVLSDYRHWIEESAELGPAVGGRVRLVKAAVGEGSGLVSSHGPVQIRLVLDSPQPLVGYVCVAVSEGPATPIFLLSRTTHLRAGETELRCSVAHLPLPRGRFFLWVGVFSPTEDLLPWHPAATFDVAGPNLDSAPRGIVRLAPVHVEARWEEDRP